MGTIDQIHCATDYLREFLWSKYGYQQSWEYRMKLGISVFRYGTCGTFRYRNTEYNIGTDTDTDWMNDTEFSVSVFFEFPAPTKNLYDKHTRGYPKVTGIVGCRTNLT